MVMFWDLISFFYETSFETIFHKTCGGPVDFYYLITGSWFLDKKTYHEIV